MVLVGDTAVGKSCLVTAYLENVFDQNYMPTVLDVYRGIKNVDGKEVSLEIHDTAGDEHLGFNRKQQYQGSDVFAICTAANSLESLENVKKWMAEIQEMEPTKPICLLMTKSDLLEELAEDQVVTKKMCLAKKKELNLQLFTSTSSKAWQDFNVHKAMTRIINSGYIFKYEKKGGDKKND